jgi:archaellum component FlaG (FlaF/FlaG flagellin family)
LTPQKSGQYTVLVYSKDANYSKRFDIYNLASYTVEEQVTELNMTSSSTNPGEVGTPVTFTATSSGSSHPLYMFLLYEDGQYKVVQDYSSDNTYSLTPQKNGTYTVLVYVKDANSSKFFELYSLNSYTVEEQVTELNITNSSTSPGNTGTPVTFTATSSGSSNPQYMFLLYEDGQYKVVQDYSSDNTYSLTPQKSGTYTVLVYVKDANSSKFFELYSLNSYTAEEQVTELNITNSSISPGNIGTPVTFTATSSGSSNPQYMFLLYEDGQYKVVQDYSSEDKFTWTPDKSGTYTFLVYAKDGSSSKSFNLYKVFTYNID